MYKVYCLKFYSICLFIPQPTPYQSIPTYHFTFSSSSSFPNFLSHSTHMYIPTYLIQTNHPIQYQALFENMKKSVETCPFHISGVRTNYSISKQPCLLSALPLSIRDLLRVCNGWVSEWSPLRQARIPCRIFPRSRRIWRDWTVC